MQDFEVLEAAADYIEEHGWCQNELEDDLGRVCVLGAFEAVTGQIFNDSVYFALTDFLGVQSVANWNNDVLSTEEYVVKSVRACAADLRERTHAPGGAK